jgi:UTP--glucose-1-phosphate uridylyltransferase
LIHLAAQENCAVAAVNPTREHLVRNYGTLSGKRMPGLPGVYEIEKIIEKPSLSLAESELQTPGLRAGHYLCLFGMNVLPHRVFELLEQGMAGDVPQGGYQLTPALQELARNEKCLAAELRGTRYDIGAKFGMMLTQIALGMAGVERDTMLAEIVELMADAGRRRENEGGAQR